jgi:hypothetical protein
MPKLVAFVSVTGALAPMEMSHSVVDAATGIL